MARGKNMSVSDINAVIASPDADTSYFIPRLTVAILGRKL